jgi:hypothetical protein
MPLLPKAVFRCLIERVIARVGRSQVCPTDARLVGVENYVGFIARGDLHFNECRTGARKR